MSKNNKSIKDRMIRKYGRKCFIEELGLRSPEEIAADLKKYKKNKRAELMALTFHHIKERRVGGEASEENGAILRNINHIWFNRLSKEEQRRINNLFQEYKAQDKFKSEAEKFRARIKVRASIIQDGEVKSEQDVDCGDREDIISIPAYDYVREVDEAEYKKYIEARRIRERSKKIWQGHTWGIDERREDEER